MKADKVGSVVCGVQAALEAKNAEMQSAATAAEKAVAEADARTTAAAKEAEQSMREAEDRRMQLTVLMETLETLQSGSLGDFLTLLSTASQMLFLSVQIQPYCYQHEFERQVGALLKRFAAICPLHQSP